MKKEIKFVDGIYGFVYDSIHGYVSKVFREPISEIEQKAMNYVIGDDDMLFVVGDEEDIMNMWNMIEGEVDVEELDINENEKIIEWK